MANGGRHSCITYQIAPTGDVAGTVVESGNSPEVINSAYRGLATETDGERYFQITPTRFNEWDRASFALTLDRLNPPQSAGRRSRLHPILLVVPLLTVGDQKPNHPGTGQRVRQSICVFRRKPDTNPI